MLHQVPVHSVESAIRLVRRALRQRTVRSTDANARSSRSHGVLQLLLEQSSSDAAAPVLRARLSLVDLAGSERVSGERSLLLDNQAATPPQPSLSTFTPPPPSTLSPPPPSPASSTGARWPR